jgi:hypothetical protein
MITTLQDETLQRIVISLISVQSYTIGITITVAWNRMNFRNRHYLSIQHAYPI